MSDAAISRARKGSCPPQDGLVDGVHDNGIGYDPHEVSAEPAVERSCTLFRNHEA